LCTTIVIIVNKRIWHFLKQCRDKPSHQVDFGLLNFSNLIEQIHDGATITCIIPAQLVPILSASLKQSKSVSFLDDIDQAATAKVAKRKANQAPHNDHHGGGGEGRGAGHNAEAATQASAKASAITTDQTLIKPWLLKTNKHMSKFISKSSTAPKLHGKVPCLNKWIGGYCKLGNDCPHIKSHPSLKKTSDEYRAFNDWVKITVHGEE
jgi:hypothetical protein